MGRRIRIVVGEGRTAQQGLLRFVLEGEGFDIVGEATSVAELAVAIAEGQPDVVVLDDGIGVMAVSMVREVLPQTKIVLVWPSAVVPIGGDTRVEPAKILNDLGPAVRHVSPVGVGAGLTEPADRPDWIERVRKDPATLRDKLGTSGKEAAKRPSVTELQRRGARLHPSSRKAKRTEPKEPSKEPAGIVILPEAAEGAAVGAEAVSREPADGEEPAAAEPIEERSEWNRRLGTLALSGAAAVSALVLALALGGGRVDTSIVRGGGYVPPGTVFSSGDTEAGPFIGGSLGGDGYSPIPTPAPGPTNGGPTGETEAAPPGGDASPPSGNTDQPDSDTTPDGGGVPRAPEGGDGGGGGGNGDGGGGGGGGAHGLAMPGRSTGNPFGGPPSKLGLTPAHGAGMGAIVNDAAEHGVRTASGHDHKH